MKYTVNGKTVNIPNEELEKSMKNIHQAKQRKKRKVLKKTK